MPAWLAPVIMAATTLAQTAGPAIQSAIDSKKLKLRQQQLKRDIELGRGTSRAEEDVFDKRMNQSLDPVRQQAAAAQSDYERLAIAQGAEAGGARQAALRREKNAMIGDAPQQATLATGLAKAQANADALAGKRQESSAIDATRSAMAQSQMSGAIRGAAQIAGTVGQAAAYEKQAPSGLWGKENYSNAQRAAMTPDPTTVGTAPDGTAARYVPATD